jgi:hypothetical protein
MTASQDVSPLVFHQMNPLSAPDAQTSKPFRHDFEFSEIFKFKVHSWMCPLPGDRGSTVLRERSVSIELMRVALKGKYT